MSIQAVQKLWSVNRASIAAYAYIAVTQTGTQTDRQTGTRPYTFLIDLIES